MANPKRTVAHPTPPLPRVTRRRLLTLAAALPFGAIIAACSSSDREEPGNPAAIDAPPTPTSTREPPLVLPPGEDRRLLMAGTPQETSLHVFGSGLPGKNLMVLGGVHGNEPGGWLAADRLLDELRPGRGHFVIVPRANRIATQLFQRTTDQLGDLNRLYPGKPDGLPMAQMALQVVDALREFRIDVLVDMHESWAFYKDRAQNGTAFLGQTVATYPGEPGISLARAVVDAVNARVGAPHEEMSYREFPPGRLPDPNSPRPFDTSGNPQAAVSGGSASSLGLPRHIPGLAVLLVEMGQQQALERRIALHVDIVNEVARRIGLIEA